MWEELIADGKEAVSEQKEAPGQARQSEADENPKRAAHGPGPLCSSWMHDPLSWV